MRDLGAPLLGDQAESSWGLGLDALVRLQQTWLGRSEELLALGAEDRPLASLATWVGETVDDVELLSLLAPDERRTWLGAVPSMVASCQRLADLAPGVSLVHGDFHPWNVVSGADSVRIFDWTDASVAHPFLDLVTYIMRTTEKCAQGEHVAPLSGWLVGVSSRRSTTRGRSPCLGRGGSPPGTHLRRAHPHSHAR